MDRGRGRGRGRRRGGERQTSSSHSTTSNHPQSIPPGDASPFSQESYQGGPETYSSHHFPSPSLDSPSSRITPRSERPARNNTQPEFTFRAPSASSSVMASPAAKKRARTVDNTQDAAVGDDATPKGGHKLRKRARVDYTQGRIDDDVAPFHPRPELAGKTIAGPGGRIRKRQHTNDLSDDESDDAIVPPNLQRRRRSDKGLASSQATPGRRKNPARRSATEIRSYVEQPSDNEVQDAIVVGAPIEESEHSSFRQSPSPPPDSTSVSEAERHFSQPQSEQLGNLPLSDEYSIAQPSAAYHERLIKEEPIDHAEMRDAVSPLSADIQDAVNLTHNGLGKDIDPVPLVSKSEDVLMKEANRATPAKDETASISPELVASPDDMSFLPDDQDTVLGAASQVSHVSQVDDASSSEIPKADPRSSPALPQSKPEVTPAYEPKEPETQVPTIITTEPEPVASLAAIPASQPVPEAADRPSVMKGLQKFYKKATAKAGPSSSYEDETVTHPARSGRVLRSNKTESSSIPSRPPTPPPVRRVKPKGTKPIKLSTKTEAGKQSESAQPNEASQASTPAASGNSSDLGQMKIPTKWTFKSFWEKFYSKYRNRCEVSGEKRRSPYDIWKEFSNNTPEAQQRMIEIVSEEIVTPSVRTEAATGESQCLSEKAQGKQPEGSANTSGDLAPPDQEARQSTAAPTPDLVEDDAVADEAIATNDEADDIDDADVEEAGKQYAFPKIRDPSAFDDLKDFAGMSTEQLASRLEEIWDYMGPLQEELNTLQKHLDDEENAKRRQQNDKAITNWDARQNLEEPLPMRRHFDDLVKGPPAFEVKGRRAPRPYIDDPVLEHQREMDKIQADSWGFKHSNLPTLVGRQNPSEQRWEMPEPRLRERKQTQKAADLAEEHILEGKRTRRPRVLADKEPTRAMTPAEPTRRGKGRGLSTLAEELEYAEFKKNGIRGAAEEMGKGRKRRVAASRQIHSVNATEDEAEIAPPRSKRQRMTRHEEDAGTALDPSASQTAAEESTRPSSSSSNVTTQTAETGESAYSLREKKPRNYAVDNDPEAVLRTRKRTRGPAHKGDNDRSSTNALHSADTTEMTENGDDQDEQPKKRRRRTKKSTAPTSGQLPLLAAAPTHLGGTTAAQPAVMAPPAGSAFHTFEMVGNKLISINPNGVKPPEAPPVGGVLRKSGASTSVDRRRKRVAFAPEVDDNEKKSKSSSSTELASKTASDTPQGGGGIKNNEGQRISVFIDESGKKKLLIKSGAKQSPINPAIAAVQSPLVNPSPDRPAKNTRSRRLQKLQPTGNTANLNPIAPNTKTPIMRVTPAARAAANAAGGAASSASAAATTAGADTGEPKEKSYSEMSKSEKMSWSMKNRWARGEMRGAVEKRKNTLAQKQKAKVATDAVARATTNGQSSDPKSPSVTAPNETAKRPRSTAPVERAVPMISPARRPPPAAPAQRPQYAMTPPPPPPQPTSFMLGGSYSNPPPDNTSYSVPPRPKPTPEQMDAYHQMMSQPTFPPGYENDPKMRGPFYQGKGSGGEGGSA